jgi:hypothetical protein
MRSQEQYVQDILDAMEKLEEGDPALNKLASYLYQADKRLSDYLEKLDKFTQLIKPTLQETQEAGQLLEQIVLLVFKGLKNVQSIKSFQSAGPQYDLLVSGNDVGWLQVCKLLYMDTSQRDIVIEAKATKSPLPDKQFARLCSIMDLNLKGAGLGIFFTLNGATGFPKAGKPRQRTLSDCRLRQIIFHAKTNKMIIVLDKSDIFELDKNGTLIEILTRKIRDLFELSGLPTTTTEKLNEIDLPNHLKTLYDSDS